MKNYAVRIAFGIFFAGLFLACDPEVKSPPESEISAPKGEVGVKADIGINLRILYCKADSIDKLVCIEQGSKPCPNCPGPPPNPNPPSAKRGNLLMKYVIAGTTLNFFGWSYKLRQGNNEFDAAPNIKMSVALRDTAVAENGTELGDFIWAYGQLRSIYCGNQGATRKNFILLLPVNFVAPNGTKQVKWEVYKTNEDPGSSSFRFDKMNNERFDKIPNAEPNPIPPKSFNIE
jgi:hypothetical protein